MGRIELDKYYTSKSLAKHCISVVNSLRLDVKEVIEPSAGNGSFSLQIPNCIAYDLEPEHETIIKQDFLELELQYKKNRLFIGNPPFGFRNTMSLRFFKKCVKYGDFIAFILPISSLNNTSRLYDFDLIYSEDLGKKKYSDRIVHCCFNIYKRPDNGILNKKKANDLRDCLIVEYGRSRPVKVIENYDYRICAWGTVGKECDYPEQYCKEFIFFINPNFKDEVIRLLKEAKWKDMYNFTGTPSIYQWMVNKYLRDNIKGIK